MEIVITMLLLVGMCDEPPEDLFCEGEACALADGAGGAGGAWGSGDGGGAGQGGAGGEEPPTTTSSTGEPPPCECDDGNSCNGREGCAGDGACTIIDPPLPVDDENICTADQCVDGEPHHEPMPQRNMDDGDPCTIDYCDATIGIMHDPIPGC
jgi:hypothetical protein